MLKKTSANNLVSILMPVYNVEGYIEEALSSITCQTYKNWQTIIIDDGSTDNTTILIEKFIKGDNRFILIKNESNQGLVKSLNFGLRQCKGEYIARFDGDDVMLPSKIEEQLNKLFLTGCDIVGCDVININENGDVCGNSNYLKSHFFISNTLKYTNPMLHCWIAKVEVYDTLCGYRELNAAEDYDFLARAQIHGYVFSSVNKPLVKIRKRAGNTSDMAAISRLRSVKYIKSLLRHQSMLPLPNYSSPPSNVEEKYRIAVRGLNFEMSRAANANRKLIVSLRSFALIEEIFIRKLSKFLVRIERLINLG